MLRALRHNSPTDRPGLIKAIHAAARELGVDTDTRKVMQQNLVGVESCKDMSLTQLRKVYGSLSVMQQGLPRRKPTRRGRDERRPDEVASVEQGRMIQHLFDDLGIPEVGTARMNLSRRTCGQSWPQTREEANKVIEALKAMRERGWKARNAGPVAACDAREEAEDLMGSIRRCGEFMTQPGRVKC
ncbi:phage protein GemA/Gp16 family protein [Candidatus Nitrospira bockiana]